MHACNTELFPDYAYCAIADNSRHSPAERLQFVAVITSKPVVSPEGSKLTWTVADKTGVVSSRPLSSFAFPFRHVVDVRNERTD